MIQIMLFMASKILWPSAHKIACPVIIGKKKTPITFKLLHKLLHNPETIRARVQEIG